MGVRPESGRLCHGVRKRDKAVGRLKERFALGSSDMVWMVFFFFKLFQMLRYFLVVCAAFCARTILQFGGKTYD